MCKSEKLSGEETEKCLPFAYSPALGMVSIESVPVKVLVPAIRVRVVFFAHMNRLRILLQVGNVMRSVPSLEHCIGCRCLLRALPEEVPP